jgi:hypothetical protein
MCFAGGEPFPQSGHFGCSTCLLGRRGWLDRRCLQLESDGAARWGIRQAGIVPQRRRHRRLALTVSVRFEKIRNGTRWDVFVRNLRQARERVLV